MNPRERILAIAIGGVAAAIIGYFAVSYVTGQFSKRSTEIARLEGEIKKSKDQVFAGQVAAKKITQYEARSLPPDEEVTRTQYQDWLLEEIQDAGLTEPDAVAHGTTVQVPAPMKLMMRSAITVHTDGVCVIRWMLPSPS